MHVRFSLVYKGVGSLTFSNHLGVSTNDLVLSDRNSLYKVCSFKVGQPNCISDHCVVSFKLNVSSHQQEGDTCIEGGSRVSARWVEGKKEEYKSRIGSENVEKEINILFDKLRDNTDIDFLEQAIGELTGLIVEAGSGHIKRVNIRGGKNVLIPRKLGAKWYDSDCKKQKEIFAEKQNKFREFGTELDRARMCIQRNIYRRVCRKKKAEFNRNEAHRLVELSKKDPKKFWGEIKKGTAVNRDLPDCNFFEHFSTLAARESRVGEEGRREIEQMENNNSVYIEDLDGPISMQELESTIKELKRDKSAGQDNIINEFIVNASLGIRIIILAIFNNILKLEVFPSSWAVGSIVPVFKKGDANNCIIKE